MRYFNLWAAGAVLAVFAITGCGGAVSKPAAEPDPTPKPAGPSAAELLAGTWRWSNPWWEDNQRIGTHYVTLTLTKSRFVFSDVDVRTDGTVDRTWRRVGAWSGSETTETHIAMTWLDTAPLGEDEEDNLPGVPRSFRVRYFWPDTERATIVVQDWDQAPHEDGGETVRLKDDYRSFAKVTEPVSTVGSWEAHRPDDDDRITLTVTGTTLLWQDHPRPGMSYDTHGRITSFDTEELFVNFTVLDDEGAEMGDGRLAFVPGHGPNVVLVSPHWDESYEDILGNWITPNPRHPHGTYWVIMIRN